MNAGDRNIIENLRRKWPKEASHFDDTALLNLYSDFKQTGLNEDAFLAEMEAAKG
jgi:hypothetical protein